MRSAELQLQHEGLFDCRFWHHACWQLHWSERQNYWRTRYGTDIRNHFSRHDEYEVRKSTLENYLTEENVLGNLSCTETFLVFHVNLFVLRIMKLPARHWNLAETSRNVSELQQHLRWLLQYAQICIRGPSARVCEVSGVIAAKNIQRVVRIHIF